MQNKSRVQGARPLTLGQQILSPTLEESLVSGEPALPTAGIPARAPRPARRCPRRSRARGSKAAVSFPLHDIEAEFLDARLSVEPPADGADLFCAIQAADPILGSFPYVWIWRMARALECLVRAGRSQVLNPHFSPGRTCIVRDRVFSNRYGSFWGWQEKQTVLGMLLACLFSSSAHMLPRSVETATLFGREHALEEKILRHDHAPW